MKQTVALIGAGVMGGAIGQRLLDTGHVVRVFDLDPSKRSALVAHGAVDCTTAAEAAQQCSFAILSLNNADIVRAAVFGDRGVAQGIATGAMVIDMSSIDPAATRQLAADAEQAGFRWLDCPLSGGAPKVAIGQLTVMAGGDGSDFELAKSVMDDLCANYTLMGPSGAGQTTKLINQVLCALNFVAVAEATQLALDAGVNASVIPKALHGGRADSAILQEFMAKMAAKDYTPTGRIDNMVKDLNSVQDLARSTGTAMPLTATCAEIHRLLTSAGLGGADSAALMKYFEGPA
ncbi:MAG: NAD(P)-dependent oxidoreductase [Pseudomonadota bacterium]